MKKQIFKGVDLLLADKDISNLEVMLLDPIHKPFNVSLETILETDDEGRIVFFMPTDQVKWGLIFYIQNLMIRQRLHQIDEFLDSQKDKDNG